MNVAELQEYVGKGLQKARVERTEDGLSVSIGYFGDGVNEWRDNYKVSEENGSAKIETLSGEERNLDGILDMLRRRSINLMI